MADTAFHFIDDVKHLLHIVVHQRLGIVRFVVRITKTYIVNRHILRTGRDSRLLEIVDVILVVKVKFIISYCANEDIVRVVIHTRSYVFPVVTTGVTRDIHGHYQFIILALRIGIDGYDLLIAAGILIAMRPEITGGRTGTSETANLRQHIFKRGTALRTRELGIFLQACAVIVNSGAPCNGSGHNARYQKQKDAFHTP